MEPEYGQSTGRTTDVSAIAARGAEATKHRSKKAAEIAKDQIGDAAVLARDAAYSGAYVWPIQVRPFGLPSVATDISSIKHLALTLFQS